jgi:hypothetical protein
MKKRLLLLWFFIGFVLITSAQEAKQERPGKKGCSCSFSSINQVGFLFGTKGAFYQAQTINGMKYKTWFAGVGVGVENYYRTGIPVFIDVRKYLFNKSSTPFAYADVGVHFVTDKHDQLNQWYENKYHNGLYAEAGIGYKFGFSGKDRWLISAGYSHKYVKYDNKFLGSPCPTSRCYEGFYTYKNYLHRYAMKIGLQF